MQTSVRTGRLARTHSMCASPGVATAAAEATAAAGTAGIQSPNATAMVYLNVYDVVTATEPALLPRLNDYLVHCGMGVFHTGIEVWGTEYAFGAHCEPESGVFEVLPRECAGVRYRLSVTLGETKLTAQEAANAADALGRTDFLGCSYSLVANNCNDFSKAFAAALGLSNNFPAWVNRLAQLAGSMSCLLPQDIHRPIGESVPQALVPVDEPRKPPRVASLDSVE